VEVRALGAPSSSAARAARPSRGIERRRHRRAAPAAPPPIPMPPRRSAIERAARLLSHHPSHPGSGKWARPQAA
jgi:hypothetical protein